MRAAAVDSLAVFTGGLPLLFFQSTFVSPDRAASRRVEALALRAWRLIAVPSLLLAFVSSSVHPKTGDLLPALLAVPWLLTGLLGALAGLLRLGATWRMGGASLAAMTAALVYAPIGAALVVASRAGVEPMGLEAPAARLLAAHFHQAGIAMPLFAGLAAAELGDRWSRIACWLAISAVPAMALAAVAARGEQGSDIRLAAATVTILAGLLCAVSQLRVTWLCRDHEALGGLLTGLSLLASTALAACWVARLFTPVPWLDTATMRATHGLLTAVGFSFIGTFFWLSRSD